MIRYTLTNQANARDARAGRLAPFGVTIAARSPLPSETRIQSGCPLVIVGHVEVAPDGTVTATPRADVQAWVVDQLIATAVECAAHGLHERDRWDSAGGYSWSPIALIGRTGVNLEDARRAILRPL